MAAFNDRHRYYLLKNIFLELLLYQENHYGNIKYGSIVWDAILNYQTEMNCKGLLVINQVTQTMAAVITFFDMLSALVCGFSPLGIHYLDDYVHFVHSTHL